MVMAFCNCLTSVLFSLCVFAEDALCDIFMIFDVHALHLFLLA